MRVLIDTNVLISYLLNPDSSGNIKTIFKAVGEGKIILLFPEMLLEELQETIRKKQELTKRIQPKELKAFIYSIKTLGEVVPKINTPIPKVTRDPKDDYLLAYSLVGGADFLVTGDKDLLVLAKEIDEVKILSPNQFVEHL